jgi:hypothetical protein
MDFLKKPEHISGWPAFSIKKFMTRLPTVNEELVELALEMNIKGAMACLKNFNPDAFEMTRLELAETFIQAMYRDPEFAEYFELIVNVNKDELERNRVEGSTGDFLEKKESESGDESLQKLEPAHRAAYNLYKFMIDLEPDMVNKTDRKVYYSLAKKSDLPHRLPKRFDTWVRYLREARRALGIQKNTRRADKATSSCVVKKEQL